MWKRIEVTLAGEVTKYRITQKDKVITYAEWIQLLKESTEFSNFFIELLKSNKYAGYFWEVKPITIDRLHEEFEFVLVNSSILPNIQADETSFSTYFVAGKKVVTFSNLRGDAQLVVPTKIEKPACYAHLAKFVRNASSTQQIAFWKIVAQEYEQAIGEAPKWLSTAGLGVYWLHVRIDSRPKYYRYQSYKKPIK